MGNLENALVQRLLDTSPKYKRDVMEETIRNLFGANQLIELNGLPARRGKADGGFDGIINISHFVRNNWIEKRAGLNIKVRNSGFTREQLGGFLLDMDRESISVGIIITATNLSPDAQSEINRKNLEGNVYLIHIMLADILSGEIVAPCIIKDNLSLNEIFRNNVGRLISIVD